MCRPGHSDTAALAKAPVQRIFSPLRSGSLAAGRFHSPLAPVRATVHICPQPRVSGGLSFGHRPFLTIACAINSRGEIPPFWMPSLRTPSKGYFHDPSRNGHAGAHLQRGKCTDAYSRTVEPGGKAGSQTGVLWDRQNFGQFTCSHHLKTPRMTSGLVLWNKELPSQELLLIQRSNIHFSLKY